MKILYQAGPEEIFDVILAKRKFARIHDVSIDNIWPEGGPYNVVQGGRPPPSKEVTIVLKIHNTKAARKILRVIEKHNQGPPLY